ncbi:hypothetical protein [Mycobacterium leprae]|uniref:hypothetical protein n=1 Tax=Mycobacterium leprae TaxID=1769 RepID=UPI003083F36B
MCLCTTQGLNHPNNAPSDADSHKDRGFVIKGFTGIDFGQRRGLGFDVEIYEVTSTPRFGPGGVSVVGRTG